MTLLEFFYDPILRGPLLGSGFLAFSSAMIGVILFVRKKSLLSETLAHATFPGVMLAALIGGYWHLKEGLEILVLIGAFLFSLLGFLSLRFLERRTKVKKDAALTFVLTAFFAAGILLTSVAQNLYPKVFRQVQSFLYGQAASMGDREIVVYGTFAVITLLFTLAFYKEILALSFDPLFSRSMRLYQKRIDAFLFILMNIVIVLGIKSVGVVLVSALLIAPAVASRQYTHSFLKMLIIAPFFGIISAFLGVILSARLSETLLSRYGFQSALPTGPMIASCVGIFALFSLAFAPKRGLAFRYGRALYFRFHCQFENLLKALWRLEASERGVSLKEVQEFSPLSKWMIWVLFFVMGRKGWLQKKKGYLLTKKGRVKGSRIIRLHRLWEAYLVNSLGLGSEKVHRSAEEIEHILTPEMEKRLSDLLENPERDPHNQPIPSTEEVYGY